MAVVLEPGECAFGTLAVVYILIGDTHRTQGHAEVTCYIQIVVHKGLIEVGIVLPVSAVRPVDGQDDDGIRVGAVFADVVHPLLDIGTESLNIGAWQAALLLQDDVAPSLAAHQHLGTWSAVLGEAVALGPVGAQWLAQQCVFGPISIFAHGQRDGVEHGILVVVVDEAIVERQYTHLLRNAGDENHLGGPYLHAHGL